MNTQERITTGRETAWAKLLPWMQKNFTLCAGMQAKRWRGDGVPKYPDYMPPFSIRKGEEGLDAYNEETKFVLRNIDPSEFHITWQSSKTMQAVLLNYCGRAKNIYRAELLHSTKTPHFRWLEGNDPEESAVWSGRTETSWNLELFWYVPEDTTAKRKTINNGSLVCLILDARDFIDNHILRSSPDAEL